MAKSIDEKIDILVVLLTDRHYRTEGDAVAFATGLDPKDLDEMLAKAKNPAAWRFFAGTDGVAIASTGDHS